MAAPISVTYSLLVVVAGIFLQIKSRPKKASADGCQIKPRMRRNAAPVRTSSLACMLLHCTTKKDRGHP